LLESHVVVFFDAVLTRGFQELLALRQVVVFGGFALCHGTSSWVASSIGENPILPARTAPQDVVVVGARNGTKRRSRFIENPATGALEISPDAWLEIDHALKRSVRRLKFRLYGRLLALYLVKARLHCLSAALHLQRYLLGFRP
jgi:hypothetical protein